MSTVEIIGSARMSRFKVECSLIDHCFWRYTIATHLPFHFEWLLMLDFFQKEFRVFVHFSKHTWYVNFEHLVNNELVDIYTWILQMFTWNLHFSLLFSFVYLLLCFSVVLLDFPRFKRGSSVINYSLLQCYYSLVIWI